MKNYAGLDVSVKETSICIVDKTGKICREVKVTSHPDDLIAVLKDPAWNMERIGLEAGPLSQWLFEGLARAGLPVICIETRHTKAFLKAQPNKSDRNDARGIAQMMRVHLYRAVHVKTLTSQKRRALLTVRKLFTKQSPLRTTCAGCCATAGSRSGWSDPRSSRRAFASSSRAPLTWSRLSSPCLTRAGSCGSTLRPCIGSF